MNRNKAETLQQRQCCDAQGRNCHKQFALNFIFFHFFCEDNLFSWWYTFLCASHRQRSRQMKSTFAEETVLYLSLSFFEAWFHLHYFCSRSFRPKKYTACAAEDQNEQKIPRKDHQVLVMLYEMMFEHENATLFNQRNEFREAAIRFYSFKSPALSCLRRV